MILIIEGVDKNGKTTLANRLVQEYGAEYVKFGQPTKPPFQEYSEFIASVDPSKTYVLDRFFIGELVYGPIYRGKSGITLGQLKDLERVLLDKVAETVIVYCKTNIEQVRTNFEAEHEEFAKASDIAALRKKYHDILKKQVLPVYGFDYLKDMDHSGIIGRLSKNVVSGRVAK